MPIMFFYPITDSLRLRPLRLADTDELFALTEANRAYLRQWLPWLDTVKSAADTRKLYSVFFAPVDREPGLWHDALSPRCDRRHHRL